LSLLQVPKPKAKCLQNTHKIVEYAVEAAGSLLEIYDDLMANRGGGAPKTEEQDLLRAMVVLAGAGLDASLKQIAQDALYTIVDVSVEAQNELMTFAERRLVRADLQGGVIFNAKEVARLIVSTSPRKVAIESLVHDLTGRSLQSFEELQRALRHFGVSNLNVDRAKLNGAFDTRNRIVHEMDMNLQHPTRKRRARKRDEMLRHVEVLLKTAAGVLDSVDKTLGSRSADG